MRDACTAQQEGYWQINRDHMLPSCMCRIDDPRLMDNPSGVHQTIETTEGVGCCIHRALHGIRVGHVGCDGDTAGVGGKAGKACLVQINTHDTSTALNDE